MLPEFSEKETIGTILDPNYDPFNGDPEREQQFDEFAKRSSEEAGVRVMKIVLNRGRETQIQTPNVVQMATGQMLRSIISSLDEDTLRELKSEIQQIDAGALSEVAATNFLRIRGLLDTDVSPLIHKASNGDKMMFSVMDDFNLGLQNPRDIRSLFERNGINFNSEEGFKYVQGVFNSAVAFYREYIGKPALPPELSEFKDEEDIYRVFQIAAGRKPAKYAPMACALLRLALCDNHIKMDSTLSILPQASSKLHGTLSKKIDEKNKTYNAGNGVIIQLTGFEYREKTHFRMLAKLAQKPSNSTREIMDGWGARLRVKKIIDVLKLIYSMFFDKETAIAAINNIHVEETKQKFFDEKDLNRVLSDPESIRQLIDIFSGKNGHIDEDHLGIDMREAQPDADNKASSSNYFSVHITATLTVTSGGKVHLIPVEFQITTQAAHENNEEKAPHDKYEGIQMASILPRLLKNNVLDQGLKHIEAQKCATTP